MNLYNKKISAQAILSLKDALAVIFWKKDDLKDFIKITLENKEIVGVINWNPIKREIAKELVERMLNNQKVYKEDLINLILAVSDFTDFSHLEYWDEDGNKRKKAKEAVERLRVHTKGFIQISKEKEEARKRRQEVEKRIAEKKSISDEIKALNLKFQQIAMNTNHQKRGYELEKFLNELFQLYELDPKDSFKLQGEQIDGAFTFDGTDYLLEAKWKSHVRRGDLADFCYKVDSKLKNAIGLMVSIDGVSPQAIIPDFKSIIIMDGSDISAILEGRVTLPDLLYKKRRKAAETGNIYINFYQL